MPPIEEELAEARKHFVDTFNELSNQFIKFSLATNALLETLKRLEEHNPTLFDKEPIS